MAGFALVPSLLPQLSQQWSLSATEGGWLGGIFFLGYILAVPVLVSLTDRIDARRIYLASAALSGLALAGFARLADSFATALGWWWLAGLGLAGTYMPGLKALTDRLPVAAQSRATAFYTATFRCRRRSLVSLDRAAALRAAMVIVVRRRGALCGAGDGAGRSWRFGRRSTTGERRRRQRPLAPRPARPAHPGFLWRLFRSQLGTLRFSRLAGGLPDVDPFPFTGGVDGDAGNGGRAGDLSRRAGEHPRQRRRTALGTPALAAGGHAIILCAGAGRRRLGERSRAIC
jgi:hypothetical protein